MRLIMIAVIAIASCNGIESATAQSTTVVTTTNGSSGGRYTACSGNDRAGDWSQRFKRGDSDSRLGVVREIRDIASGAATATSANGASSMACLSTGLRQYYGHRARRQQTFLDVGSFVTGVGGFGAAVSGGAGSHTQTLWGYGALAPVLISRFNANEPTRDLYHGGGQGLDLINIRYARMQGLSRDLSTLLALDSKALVDACEAMRNKMVGVEAWPMGERRLTTLNDLRTIEQACTQAQLADQEIGYIRTEASARLANIDQLQAADIVRLDSAITARDQQLSFSPLATLQAIAAAPFETAGTLLSGEDGRKAIDNLKTQAAFGSLDMQLSTVVLTATPALLPSVSWNRPISTATDSATRLREAEVFAIMASAVQRYNERRLTLNRATNLSAELRQFALLDHLTFEFDPNSANVSVKLGPKPVAPTVTLTAPASQATP